jgi:hypothetical protein
MKRINITLLLVLALSLFGLKANAQKVDSNSGLVVWTGMTLSQAVQASQDGFVYLLQFKPTLSETDKEKYISQGGTYGVQGVLSSIGMRMQIIHSPNNRNYYQVITRVLNSNNQSESLLKDRLAFSELGAGKNLYLDRGTAIITEGLTNYPDWTINEGTAIKSNIRYVGEETTQNVTVQTIKFENRSTTGGGWGQATTHYYLTVNNQGKLVASTNSSDATQWVVVSEEDFNNAMTQVTWGEVDLGVFVQGGEFSRDNKDLESWVWGSVFTNQGESTAYDDQDDSYVINSSSNHWHQRNQNKMCNGVEFESKVNGNTVNHNISGSKVGTNIDGVGANNSYDKEAFQNHFADYYAGEIYNEAISLSQQLQGSTIPNLVDGLYKITAQALYYDGDQGTTNNGISYFVIKRDELNSDGSIKNTSFEKLPIAPLKSEGDGYDIVPESGVSAGYVFDTESKAYNIVYFVEISGNTNLTIGIEQTEATGWTVIGNIHLFAHGKQALFMDIDWGESETLTFKNNDDNVVYEGDPYYQVQFYDNYEYPATVYYQREFLPNKWTTICLPFNLTGSQVAQAFGDGTKVSTLNKLDGVCLRFAAAPDIASNLNTVIIEAGQPYIIKPTKESPDYEEGATLMVGNGRENHTVTVDGNIYAIAGVTKDNSYNEVTTEDNPFSIATMTTYVGETDEVKEVKPINITTKLKDPIKITDEASGISFVGSFHHKVINKEDVYNAKTNPSGSAEYWVFSKGDMYHLQGTKDWNIWATYAYLTLPKGTTGSAKDYYFSVDVDGVEETGLLTEIENIFSESVREEDSKVYNISGQRLGGNSLQKGIYIKNGKKFIVK